MDGVCLKAGLMTSPITVADARTIPSAVVRAPANAISSEKPSTPWGFPMKYSFRSFWPVPRKRVGGFSTNDAVYVDGEAEKNVVIGGDENWVLKILQLRSLRKDDDRNEIGGGEMEETEKNGGGEERCDCSGEEEFDVCYEDDENVEFDKGSFSKMLRRVNLAEARVYAQMCYLGNLAYAIPRIKPGDLLKYQGLRFVTSSFEKREQALKAEKEKVSAEIREQEKDSEEAREKQKVVDEVQRKDEGSAQILEGNEVAVDMVETDEEKSKEDRVNAYLAYRIAASAASYLLSQTTSLLPLNSIKTEVKQDLPEGGVGGVDMLNNIDKMNGDVASLIATTDSVTSVVAAKEEVKQAVADDLNSTRSTPCEWFICDRTTTRFFVIQGSDSLASWQANLLFEPIPFEGSDVLVHRGIYEAAKGIYEQMLPEVRYHVKNYGDRAIFRFTGHSLGGSLSLLVNLMLLIRGELPPSSLLPVITFGAPSIMCGGDRLLQRLGLPKSHVQSIAMHRDIVPRVFSCYYPNHVTELLKAVNGKFRNHSCLENNGCLYFPMGEFLILQPDEEFSPHHELLPSGSGFYLLTSPITDAKEAEKHIRAAKGVFLNSPHPLEVMSDRSSYGSEGTILRNHDTNMYLQSIQNLLRQEVNQLRKTRRDHRRNFLWPLFAPNGISGGKTVDNPVASSPSLNKGLFNFAGALQTGRESLGRLGKLLTSRNIHLLVLFLPARMLILGVCNMINFH